MQCIYELDVATGTLESEDVAASGVVENSHPADPDAAAIFADAL